MEEGSNQDEGHWQLLRVLGSGGFGQVTLWYDSLTGKKIAIKKLLEGTLKDPTVKTKLTERWCNEVEIMKKLNHTNIVSTLEIPAELKNLDSLPVLAMEYCSNGNLRQILNKAENCCGLQEFEVLDILRDISNGLAYLHSCKIIHRDIKPDNIVLQEKGSVMIYKLIDLGYAKTLDQSSLSKSFVGTVQYIAPELFMGKAYTSSVDYWSFGLMAHEIITGYRPFLPGFDPSDWMKQIQNKNRNVIWVMENSKGEVVFNTKISRKNHSSSCFLENIEKWLQLALDWDGQTRGRELEKSRLVIFEDLTKILCKKIIKVFSLPTYEILSYEINGETDISDLRELIKADVGVEKEDQLLLLPSGKCLNKNGNLLKNFDTEKPNVSGVSLFLYNSCSVGVKTDTIKTPIFIDEIRKTSDDLLVYRHLKRCCADSVYFLQSQANLYKFLLQAIRVKIANTKQKTLAVESLYEDLEEEWTRIEHYGHFMSFSHKVDLENYIYYRKAGKLKTSLLVRKWIQNALDVNNNITKLKNSFNKTKQRQLVLLAKQRCRNLDDHSNNDIAQRTPVDSLVEKGQSIWENLQGLSKNDRKTPFSVSSIVELVNKALLETDRFLNSEMLKTLFAKISEADENLAKFLSQLTTVSKSTNVLKRIIENTQAERQKEVWSLVESAKDELYNPEESSENGDSETLNGFVGKTENELITQKTTACDKSDILSLQESATSIKGSHSSFIPCSVSVLSLPSTTDACSIIEDNNQLRYKIQELQQNWNKMAKEISSLNWDFISE